jgi:transposase InsO family protein
MVRFIDDHRDAYGVESICAMLPIAPSTYYLQNAREADPALRSARAQLDDQWRTEIQRVFDANHQVYGPRKVWRQLRREAHDVARCTVGRLMRAMGLRGIVSGRTWITTTEAADAGAQVPDLVDRAFTATQPNQLWVSDFTYVATWRGFVFVAFVIEVFSRRIVGWRASASMRTDLALDALEQPIYDRCDDDTGDLVHHSDGGSQYLSIRYIERLADAGIECSVCSRGDAYDNELAESVIGFVQDGGDSSAGAVAKLGCGGICHAGVGGLVQLPQATGTDRLRAAGRIRSGLLSTGRSGLTEQICSPRFAVRFSALMRSSCSGTRILCEI